MSDILLTGSRGFIGGNLVKLLISKGIDFIEFNGDITKELSPQQDCGVSNRKFIGDDVKAYKNQEISRVVHIAGRTVVPDSWKDPAGYYFCNTFGTLNILEYCRENEIPLTYISAYVYGIPDELPITEKTKPNPNNPYAHSKYMAEMLCESYSQNYGIPVTILRLFNVYGKEQSDAFIIPIIVKQVLASESISVKDVEPKRDYIHVTDVAEAIISTFGYAASADGASAFNIASGKSYSVREIISIAQDIAKTKKPVLCENIVRKNEVNNIEVDITHAVNELGWQPKVTIAQGIAEMLREKETGL